MYAVAKRPSRWDNMGFYLKEGKGEGEVKTAGISLPPEAAAAGAEVAVAAVAAVAAVEKEVGREETGPAREGC